MNKTICKACGNKDARYMTDSMRHYRYCADCGVEEQVSEAEAESLNIKMHVYVYRVVNGNNEEFKVFSSLEKAINYTKFKCCENAKFEQYKYNENSWFYDDLKGSVDIFKLEIE